MSRLLAAMLSALRSGRFLSVLSLAATLPLSMTVMAPFGAGADAPSAWPATVATWLCFTTALVLVAVVERRVPQPPVRAAVVAGGIVVCAALRPVVQDLWTTASGLPTPPSGQLPFRIATNILVWAVVFAVVAVLEHTMRNLRRTNEMLRAVATELTRARERACDFDARADQAVCAAASELRAGVEALDPRHGSDGAVQRLGAGGFRSWSHRLRALADEPGEGAESGDAVEDTGSARRGRATAERHPARAGHTAREGRTAPTWHRAPFRVPATGVVTVVYAAAVLPYALRCMNPPSLLVGLILLVGGGAAIDAAVRGRVLARRRGAAPVAFLALSGVWGVALWAQAVASGIPPVIAVVSALVYLLFAAAAGLCAGAMHALGREQRRLSGAIAAAQRSTRDGTRPVRAALRRAAELLHRDGQGECTVFGLTHPDPTPTDIDRLRGALIGTISRIPAVLAGSGEPGDAVAALTALLDTWGRVIDLRIEQSDAARAALRLDPWAARDAYDLVAEGLLNAVKHAAERRAEVTIDVVATGAGPHLRARVRSFGPMPPGAHLRPASHMRDLGARLHPVPGGAVLEAILPLPAGVTVSATPGR